MKNVKEPILKAITYLIRMSSKKYCYPSQYAILKILNTHYNLSICRRTLNYHLRDLENDNYIKRVRRVSRGPDNKPLFTSTLYFVKRKVFTWLKKQADFLHFIGFHISKRAVPPVSPFTGKLAAAAVSQPPPTPAQNLSRLQDLQASFA